MPNWIGRALRSSGYQADFSLESLHEIDRFFDEQAPNCVVKPGGLLAEDFGKRIFAIGCYIGEVMRRFTGGEWEGDDFDPAAEFNLAAPAQRGPHNLADAASHQALQAW